MYSFSILHLSTLVHSFSFLLFYVISGFCTWCGTLYCVPTIFFPLCSVSVVQSLHPVVLNLGILTSYLCLEIFIIDITESNVTDMNFTSSRDAAKYPTIHQGKNKM
jgi:hypothetical protein